MNAKFSKRALKRYDRAFDAVTWVIGVAHVAALALLITNLIPAWAFVIIMVVTRTALAGAGHYHLHRKWKQRQGPFTLPRRKSTLRHQLRRHEPDRNATGTCCCTILTWAPEPM